MTRLVVVAFFGPARTQAAEHPHESPPVMTVPLIILAVLSVIGGWRSSASRTYYHGWSVDVLRTTGQLPHGRSAGAETGFFLGIDRPARVVVVGIALAYVLYCGRATDPLDIKVLANKFYFDEFYDRSLVGGQQMLARFLNWIDSWILDGLIIRGAAYVSVGVGELLASSRPAASRPTPFSSASAARS